MSKSVLCASAPRWQKATHLLSLACVAFLSLPCASAFSPFSPPSFVAAGRDRSSSLAPPSPLYMSSDSTGGGGSIPSSLQKKRLRTFSRYLEVECWKMNEIRAIEPVLLSVARACKQINRIVQRAMTDDLYGPASGPDGLPLDENVQGEVQQKLDVVCNTIMLRALCGCGDAVGAVASEEEDTTRTCAEVMGDAAFAAGDYVAVFDPIDGSANIDSSLPVGTIFGIYRRFPGAGPGSVGSDEKSFLQEGNNMVAAGYCLYSATTVLVVTLGSGVDGFTLDPDKGEFFHTHPDIRIPDNGSIYSFNEANINEFSEPVRKYISAFRTGGTGGGGMPPGAKASARYVGALVADVHNVLIRGGIYGYPSTLSNPDGKLRLLYECCPMAMVMEQAGGAASTGAGRILDLQPTEIHQRCPVFLGSTENVFELDQFHRYYGEEDG
mmetsp:Transcript_19803/g.39457  ORF Transcript_19803/g.39457 Transcript_19803/m.39457 type:complete len:438 (-) Transcript_19803:259-1572(-)